MSKPFCIVGPLFGPADGQQECGSCYQIDMRALVAIVVCDITLTILIAITVFCLATFQKKRSNCECHDAGRGRLPSATLKKRAAEITESPYQELHGVQSDVYSDLQHFRK
ncbi:TYRO protein tyrosine kinase-binding protein [Lampris incognitus]|uniref:TYRO protein tyrosine kinase-binding protein n=1 Tax=Lampris incognitus TaxID=2546036 RepID=UPI0024B5A812|nr:TYRO protein tyrosine kinase-binding protein [Lampris incognitus]